jgi:hypothetical protein
MATEPDGKVWRILGKGTRPLPVPLPEEEVLGAAHKVGDLDASMQEIENEVDGLKTQVKGLNTRLETLQVELRENARIVRSGSVERPVNTRTEITTDGKQVQVIREDTNEVIEERDSTADERQMGLFNQNLAAQVDAAIQSGKKDEPEVKEKIDPESYDLSSLTPEEQAAREADAEEYLKKKKKKKYPKDTGEEDV